MRTLRYFNALAESHYMRRLSAQLAERAALQYFIYFYQRLRRQRET